MKKSIFNWSGGKDSALALYKVLNNDQIEIHSLVTTVNQEISRISMHGVREALLDLQATSIGIPLKKILLSEMPSMEEYNTQMKIMLEDFKAEGITHSIFGDIFLEDLKQYRDNKLTEVGVQGVYPLWKKDTKKILDQFIELGFKSIVICIDTKYLDDSFLGRELDQEFIRDLPGNVDVCGENGEFHTFVYDGPIFKSAIPFDKGEIVFKNYSQDNDHELSNNTGFGYLDLIDID